MKIWISYWLLSHNTNFEIACTSLFWNYYILRYYIMRQKSYYNLRWKIITFCVENFITFCVNVITFCVSITFCGDYYILRCNTTFCLIIIHLILVSIIIGNNLRQKPWNTYLRRIVSEPKYTPNTCSEIRVNCWLVKSWWGYVSALKCVSAH